MDAFTPSFRNDLRAKTIWDRRGPHYEADCSKCGQKIVFDYDKGILRQTEGCAHFPKFHNCGSAGIYFGEN